MSAVRITHYLIPLESIAYAESFGTGGRVWLRSGCNVGNVTVIEVSEADWPEVSETIRRGPGSSPPPAPKRRSRKVQRAQA